MKGAAGSSIVYFPSRARVSLDADDFPQVAGERPMHGENAGAMMTGIRKYRPSARVDRRQKCSASTNNNPWKEKDSRPDWIRRMRSALFFTKGSPRWDAKTQPITNDFL